jgi:hypothetical protein
MILEQLVRVVVSVVLLLVLFPIVAALTFRLGDILERCRRQYRRYAVYVMKKLYGNEIESVQRKVLDEYDINRELK